MASYTSNYGGGYRRTNQGFGYASWDQSGVNSKCWLLRILLEWEYLVCSQDREEQTVKKMGTTDVMNPEILKEEESILMEIP